MIALGIDDSGRGPIIGPMILAGVLLDENGKTALKKANVKESKQVIHSTRIKMAELIKKSALAFHIVKSLPEEIDFSIKTGMNLNTLEAKKTAEIINALNSEKNKIKVLVDCPSINIKAWKRTLIGFVEKPDNLDILCEHKADVNYIEVAAASILAKVAREEEIKLLKEKYKKFGNIGSGYPSDPYTKEFLKKHGKELSSSGIFRKTWQTWKRLFQEKEQATLEEF